MNLDLIDTNWIMDKLHNDFAGFGKFFDQLNEPRFSVSQLNITRQELRNWKNVGIIDNEESNTRKWTKVNLFEYSWITLIRQLRYELNVPLETIIKFKNHLQINDDDLRSMIRNSLNMNKDLYENNPEMQSPEVKQMIFELPPFLIDIYKQFFNLFNLLTLSIIMGRSGIHLLINSNGNFIVKTNTLYEKDEFRKPIDEFQEKPLYSIPLHKLLDEFYTGPLIKNSDRKDIFNLTPIELKVLELLQTKNVKEIKIKLNDTYKGEIVIEVTEKKDILEMREKLSAILKKGKFENFNIISDNGKLVLFETTSKIRIPTKNKKIN